MKTLSFTIAVLFGSAATSLGTDTITVTYVTPTTTVYVPLYTRGCTPQKYRIHNARLLGITPQSKVDNYRWTLPKVIKYNP